jgi:hypothetical protein
MKKAIIILLPVICLVSCQQKQTDNSSAAATTTVAENPAVVGGDLDKNGCKGSAGYTWSVLRNECVRIFEVGVRLNPQDATLDQTLSAFVVLAKDSTQVELFLPQLDGSKLLKKGQKTGEWSDGNWALTQQQGTYTLKEGGKIRYQGK